MIDEGYIKFDIDWRRGPPPDAQTVADLNRWRKLLYEAGLIGEYTDLGIGFGNISMRSGAAGHFVISGTQTGHLGDLGPEHYALVTGYDVAANRVSCRGQVKASSESMTHAAIYELNPAITGVVHVHSAAMWNRLINRLPTTNPDVAYGTPAMAQEFRRLYDDTDFVDKGVAIMAGHDEGIISFGADLAEAAGRILDLRGRN
ncbi:MAG: class II aldolase/adducin family protein [Woeseia sp.]